MTRGMQDFALADHEDAGLMHRASDATKAPTRRLFLTYEIEDGERRVTNTKVMSHDLLARARDSALLLSLEVSALVQDAEVTWAAAE